MAVEDVMVGIPEMESMPAISTESTQVLEIGTLMAGIPETRTGWLRPYMR